MAKKTLRLLSLRFVNKVVTHNVVPIKEAKDFKMMKLKELMRSLRTFEIQLIEDNKDRKKTIGFCIEVLPDEKKRDDLVDSMALLVKNLE